MSAGSHPPWLTAPSELRKLAAFVRRDWLVTLSYRTALVTDWFAILAQVLLFAFIGEMVAVEAIPEYGGRQPSYLEFATIGIIVNTLLNVGLNGLVTVMGGEQRTGTLEQVLSTSVRMPTYQVGSGLFALLYTPVRLIVLLGLVAALLGGRFSFADLGPALLVLAAFVPVVWGIGLAAAGSVVTIRRGAGIAGFAGIVLGAASGAYFPIDLLPSWLQAVMRYNPVTVTLETTRAVLLGGAGWAAVWQPVAVLLAAGAAAIAVGSLVFRMALRRELRKGTLSLY